MMGFTVSHRMDAKVVAIKQNRKVVPLTDVMKTGCWSGQRCFVVAGGHSLKDFDYSLLKEELTIGVNIIFEKFDATLNYCMDRKIYDHCTNPSSDTLVPRWAEIQRAWQLYQGTMVFLRVCKKAKYNSGVYVVERQIPENVSLSLEEGIFGGNNSGFGALMLAIALGANPIYLLGFDMKMGTDERTGKECSHCHEGYPVQINENLESRFGKFKKQFEDFANRIHETNVDVFNLNRNSDLKCFPFIEIEEVLCGID